MDVPLDAMILAAGRGQRMRPLSDHTPKPLLRPGGDHKPALIEYHLAALARCKVINVIINCAWLGEQLPETLGDGSRYGVRIRYSREPQHALGTGGAIVSALPLFRSDRFIVINGDIWCDLPLQRLLESEPPDTDTDTTDGCVVLVDNPGHHPGGDFVLADGRALALDTANAATNRHSLTFSGIGLYARRLFETLPVGRFALTPILHKAARAGRLLGIHHQGRWVDVGTSQRFAALSSLLEKNGAP